MKKLIRNNKDLAFIVDYLMNYEVVKPMKFSFEKVKQIRSLDQNSLLWLWMAALEKDSETGYTKDDFYQMFLEKFAPRKEVMNEMIIISSSNMNKSQMSKFLDDIQRFSLTDIGFSLPDPKDQHFAQFKEYYKDYL